MKLLTGNSNKTLSKKISSKLKSRLINSSIRKFADGEIYIEINENIRGNSIFIIQSVSSPANDNLMELLLCIDALKRSSAKNITAVIPYFGYARQDRKIVPRTSISAKLVSISASSFSATLRRNRAWVGKNSSINSIWSLAVYRDTSNAYATKYNQRMQL